MIRENEKIIIATDSFKGSLTSLEAGGIIAEEAKQVCPQADVRVFSMADGGEGTIAAIERTMPCRRIHLTVHDPLMRAVEADYLWTDSSTAIIEMAEASGLTRLKDRERDPLFTTTYGTGEQIRDALERKAAHIYITLGGSATNDGGAGAMEALGMKFLDENGTAVHPIGADLGTIARLDSSGVHPFLNKTEITLLCDVENPLLGADGAASVYGPQKGADRTEIHLLETGMEHYIDLIEAQAGHIVRLMPGTGAAGGFAVPFLAFYHARVQSGIQAVLELSGFDEAIRDADLVITGEGSIDSQSMQGKALTGIGRRCRENGRRCIAFAGRIRLSPENLNKMGIAEAIAISDPAVPVEVSMAAAREHLRAAAHAWFQKEREQKN